MATIDHHYIPKFYLKRWANQRDGMVTVFQQQPSGLHAKLKAPAGTGYVKHLYTATMNPKLGDQLETQFMQRVDDDAAKVLELMLLPTIPELTTKQHNAWVQFLMSLMHRSPQRIATLRAQLEHHLPASRDNLTEELLREYEELRRPGDPDTLHEYLENVRPADIEYGSLRLVADLSNSQLVGDTLVKLRKRVVRFHQPKHNLITSDRPLIMTGGLGNPETVIMLALDPLHLFLAGHSEERLLALGPAGDDGRMIRFYNMRVCQEAEQYVYATSVAQRPYVEKHFRRLS